MHLISNPEQVHVAKLLVTSYKKLQFRVRNAKDINSILPELHLNMFHFVPLHQMDLPQAQVKRLLHPQGIGWKQWPVPLVPGSKVRTGKSGHVAAEAVVDSSEIYKQ